MKQTDIVRMIDNMTQGFAKVPIPKYIPKYQFTRAKWYEVDLFNSLHVMDEVRGWCTQHFGQQDYNPDAWSRWTNNRNSLFRFRDAKDYAWFMLRWS